ncbi:hypothetical protein GQ607_006796 [Colletotrichum asianum]|uniref:Uncharacterized protein n=1 Tax=Colletotrichum asianum TaxID=702518 RepID=A0A8H3WDH1_9PEZI|nr:hypothetical protein GQ607_006796 [Colletotrichum asianum]
MGSLRLWLEVMQDWKQAWRKGDWPGWNWLNLDLDHADTARTEMTDGRHRHSLTHTLAHTHTHTRRIPNDTQALLRLQHVPSGSDIPPRATHSLLLLRERLRGSSHWACGTTQQSEGDPCSKAPWLQQRQPPLCHDTVSHCHAHRLGPSKGVNQGRATTLPAPGTQSHCCQRPPSVRPYILSMQQQC